MKKVLSVTLAIILILSIVPTELFSIVASATNENVIDSITALANGTYNSSSSYLKYKVGNYFNSKITSACSPHTSSNKCPDKTCIYGSVTINGTTFSGTQCMGFAYDIFRILYGERYGVTNISATKITWDSVTDPATWIKNTVKPGDYIRFGGHSAIVIGTTSQYLKLYEANGYYSEYQTQPCRVTINANRSWSSVSTKISQHGGSLYIWRANTNLSSSENDIWLLSPPDGVLSLRTGATTSATKICDIPGDNYITVTQYANDGKWDWGYTTYNGQSGWICLYYASKHTSHSYDSWTTTKKATCTVAGNQQRKCVCGATETKTIDALGHSYSTSWTIDNAATCTTSGSKSYHCTVCSAKKDVTPIPATGHSYGQWITTKEATCTAPGDQQRKCACGATETKTIDALGHSYSTSWTIDNAATCTTSGSKSYHCTVCSAKKDVTPIPATGHSYGQWITTKEATCTAPGGQQRKCACGATETKQVEALGHSYSDSYIIENEPSCTQTGSKYRQCARCSAKTDTTTILANGHSYSDWKTVQEASCTADGRSERNCACGAKEYKAVSATGHKWSGWTVTKEATTDHTGEEARTCSLCSKQDAKAIPKLSADGHEHLFDENGWVEITPATCTQEGRRERYCNLCYTEDVQIIPALSHAFSDWQIVSEPTTEQEGMSARTCTRCAHTEELSLPKLNTSDTTPSTDPAPPSDSTPEPPSNVPVQQDTPSENGADETDILIVLTAVSLLFGAGSICALVVTIVKKKK